MASTPTIAPVAPVLEHFIELSDVEFEAVAKQTRTKTPSVYEEDVKNAVIGKAYQRAIPEGEVARTIVNKLTKAAKALDVKIQIIVREKATPPVVVFRTLAPVVEEPTA